MFLILKVLERALAIRSLKYYGDCGEKVACNAGKYSNDWDLLTELVFVTTNFQDPR